MRAMKDGLYDWRFVALDKDSRGTVRVRRNLVDGGDPLHTVRGQVSRAGANMLASFEIQWRTPPVHAVEGGPTSYTIRMFGSGTDTEFSLIGLGPVGLIVELQGTWRAPLPDAGDEMDRQAEASKGE